MNVFLGITSRFNLSQIILHSDYLNVMPKMGLQTGRGATRKSVSSKTGPVSIAEKYFFHFKVICDQNLSYLSHF